MLDENMTIKSPSVAPEVLEYIKEQAEYWKCSDRQGKSQITKKIKEQYDIESVEYEYFTKLKQTKPQKTKKVSTNRKNRVEESKDRKKFGDCLSKYLKKYLYTRNGYDATEGVFLVDDNFNLPSYFWMRMNTNVLPKWIENGIVERHAWTLGRMTIQRHEDELIYRLQNTNFNDLNHVSNSIIQFLEKHMLSTYVEIKKEAQQKLIKQSNIEKNIKKDEILSQDLKKDEQPTINRSTLKKKRKIIDF